MKNKNLTFVIVVGIGVLFLVVIGFKKGDTPVAANADPAAVYQAKCAVCHTAKAEKFFDPGKPDEQLSAVILKGKRDARPPMPEYATKGITPDGAKALVAYMRGLRTPAGANTNANVNAANVNTANTNANVNTSVNSNANANTNANSNAVGNANAVSNANTTVGKIPDAELAAIYKAKCAMCHSPKAEKAYNPEMPLAEQINAILKGKKAAKPPHMPEFETKGITAEQAAALAGFMISLRTAGK